MSRSFFTGRHIANERCDRAHLDTFLTAIDASPTALERPVCRGWVGDYQITGKHGHVLADGAGFLLYVGTNEQSADGPTQSDTDHRRKAPERAEEARLAAMASGQISAAVAAIKEKGIFSGKRIERREIGAPGEFDALTDDELERALVERFSALGLMPDAGSDMRH
jgi:hypothetical protein